MESDPNYAWHIDDQDKLKRFVKVFMSFQKKLIRLEVTLSNKVTEIMSQYYVKAVKSLKGVPKKMKVDDGTEHWLIKPMPISTQS